MIVKINRCDREPIVAGPGMPTRVMALIGMSAQNDYDSQVRKVDALVQMEHGPDIIADLSIVRPQQPPLWRRIADLGIASAALPVYSVSRSDKRIVATELLDLALEQMEVGVGLLTIHPTATHELVEKALRRVVPWTSRGGGLVISDLVSSRRTDNVYRMILPDLIDAAAQFGTVLSIGATFRSANIFDSMDEVQRTEISAQLELARQISDAGVGVIIESPGHARPADIAVCGRLLASSGFPVMPLGPIPTDVAVGFDHVAAAIGATLMGMEGAAHIIAAVTREEHTGNIPTVESTLEAVRAARVAAHVIDIHLLNATQPDARVVEQRAEHHTCIAGKKTTGCSRCASTCPLDLP